MEILWEVSIRICALDFKLNVDHSFGLLRPRLLPLFFLFAEERLAA